MADVTCTWLNFDGTDDSAAFADDASYDVSSALSMFVWLNRDYEDSESTLLSRSGTILVKFGSHDELVATVYGVTAVTSKVSFPRQELMSIGLAIAEDGTGLRFSFYKNGALVDRQSVATAAFPAATNTGLYVGSTGGSSAFYRGRMTNLLVTGDEVTATEMKTLHDNGVLSQDVALISDDFIGIPFNEGTGTTLDNDSTAGLDGTLSGTPVWAGNEGLHLGGVQMTAKTQDDRYYGNVYVETIEWIAPTTTAHLSEVTDWAGNPIFNDKCSVAYTGNGQKTVGRIVNGLKVSDLDSGYLAITYR